MCFLDPALPFPGPFCTTRSHDQNTWEQALSPPPSRRVLSRDSGRAQENGPEEETGTGPRVQTPGVLHPVGKAGVRVGEQAGPLLLRPESGNVYREGTIQQTVMHRLCGFD